jgi:hypothetical protein
MKLLFGYFNAEVGRENIFKPTNENESLHHGSNDNGVSIVNFATSTNLVFKSTKFPHPNIHDIAWTSPDGKIHIQIDHILMMAFAYTRSRSFRGTECVSDHSLEGAKLRECLAGSQAAEQKFDGKIFNLMKLYKLEVRKQYQINISIRFTALEDLTDS